MHFPVAGCFGCLKIKKYVKSHHSWNRFCRGLYTAGLRGFFLSAAREELKPPGLQAGV